MISTRTDGEADAASGTKGERDLVSVIIPTFNRARTLPRAVWSVLGQSYRNLELLIMDDGSTDETAQLIAAIDDPRIRYVLLEGNRGASRARNAGLKLARGEFIAFQDSDDEWLMDKLGRQVEAARQAASSAVTVFHTKIQYGRDEQSRYGPNRVCCIPALDNPSQDDLKRLIGEGNLVSTQTLFITRDALDRVGPFDELLVNNNDWAFAIELFHNTEVVFINEPLVMTYLQNDSISKIKRSGARSQLRIVQKLRRYRATSDAAIAGHLGRIGWGITKLGNPRLARRLLVRALMIQPAHLKNWARLVVTQGRLLKGDWRRGSPIVAR